MNHDILHLTVIYYIFLVGWLVGLVGGWLVGQLVGQ